MVMSSTVMVAYRFRGYEYHVTLGVGEEKLKEVMTIEVEDDATADQWKGTFTADYIQGTKSREGFDGFSDFFDGNWQAAFTGDRCFDDFNDEAIRAFSLGKQNLSLHRCKYR